MRRVCRESCQAVMEKQLGTRSIKQVLIFPSVAAFSVVSSFMGLLGVITVSLLEFPYFLFISKLSTHFNSSYSHIETKLFAFIYIFKLVAVDSEAYLRPYLWE